MNIDSIQREVMVILERIDLLNKLVLLAINRFSNKELAFDFIPFNRRFDEYTRIIPVSLKNYEEICEVEDELVILTTKLNFLMALLSGICKDKHDYRFMGIDDIFDFSSLEITLEKRYIYTCSICGKSILLDEKRDYLSGDDEVLRLRKAKNMDIYQSHFMIDSSLDKKFL